MVDKRENFYILLELSYDPPVVDEDVIEQAIKKKTKQWNKESQVFSLKQKAQENRNLLPEIHEVMFDADARAREAAAAKKQVEAQTAEADATFNEKFDKAVLYFQARGFVTEENIKSLAEQLNTTVDKIRPMIPKDLIQNEPVSQKPQRKVREYIASFDYEKIQNHLTELQIKPAVGTVPTLYDFLNQPESTAREAIYLYAENQSKLLAQKNHANVYNYEAHKDLYVYATMFFKDEKNYKKYNNTVLKARFDESTQILRIVGEKTIDAKTKQILIDAMLDQGIKKKDAEEMLEDYCAEKGIVLMVSDSHAADAQRCSDCGHYNLKDAKFCEKCSSALERTCISCKVVSKVSAQVCRNCQASFSDMRTFDQLLALTEKAIKNKCIREASSYTLKAKELFDTPELKAFNRKIHEVNNKVAAIRTDCEKLLHDKKIYTAAQKLKAAYQYATDNQHAIALTEKINKEIDSIEKLYKQAQQASKEELSALVATLNSKVSDAPFLADLISKTPPKGARFSKDEVADGKVYLEWKAPEKGDLTYKVYRQLAEPDSTEPSKLVCETTSLSFVDATLPIDRPHYYYLHTFRGNLQSEDAPDETLVGVMQEVTDVTVMYDEGTVELRWKGVEGKDVVIIREKGGMPELSDDVEELYPTETGLFIDNVEEGEMYGYKILLRTAKDGYHIYSYGVDVQVTAKTIPHYTALDVVKTKEALALHFMEPFAGAMNLYVSDEPFSFKSFELCGRDQLESLKPLLWQSITSSQQQVDLKTLAEGKYVLPVLTEGEVGRVCKPLYIIDLKPIENGKIEQFGEHYKMTFTVPVGAQRIEILYANEPLEDNKHYETILIEVEKYSAEDGIVLPISNVEPVYVTTRCSAFVLGEVIRSDKKRLFYLDENTYTIDYRIENLSGMFGIISRPHFAITIPENIPYIPAMTLVSAQGTYPISQTQGQLVAKTNKATRETFESLNPGFKLTDNKILFDLKEFAGKKHYYALFLSFEGEASLFHLNKTASTKL